jgi:hypothetical protein
MKEGDQMSIYDNEVKRKLIGIRLTNFQQERLEKICKTFGISHQRLLTDLLDNFCVDYWQTLNSRETINETTKHSAQKLFDDYVGLDKLKGVTPNPCPRKDSQTSFRSGLVEE